MRGCTVRSPAVLPVAYDAGPLLGARTGVGIATAGMADALGERGDIELHRYVLSGRAALPHGTKRLPLPAAAAHRLWARTGRPRVDRWLAPARVVHGTNYVVPPSRLPRLVSVYDCWFLRYPSEVSNTVRRAGDVLKRAVATGAVVHTTSHATAGEVADLLRGARVEVIPLGAPPVPPPAPGTATPDPRLSGAPFVLALGTLERRKNLPTLIAAWASAPELADTHLVIAGGDGDDLPAIDAALAQVTAVRRSSVLLLGRVDDEARSWLIHHAAVLAYPSLDEGFGFPLLEAMSAGVPIVASTAGSIPEVTGDAALLCGPRDADALAGHLVTVLVDASARQRLVDAGQAQVARFSWRTAANQLADLYHALAADRG